MIEEETDLHAVTRREADLQIAEKDASHVEVRPSFNDHDIEHDINAEGKYAEEVFHPREEPYPSGPPAV